MNEMLDYLSAMPDHHKVLWLALCLSLASLLERVIPLSKQHYDGWKHVRVNMFFLATTFVINALFSLVLVKLLPVLAEHKIGLFYWLSLPIWLELVVAVIVLDLLAQYTIHYLLHNVKFLWRFHQVHHSDAHVTATTGTRHHPVDYCARETFTLLTVALLGVPIAYYVIYRLLTVFCTYFTHANIKLPDAVDKALSYVIVTPKAHKFHHHYQVPWTDRNYGNILSIWDRLFGTFVYDSTDKIRYGVDSMDETKVDDITYQLMMPFRR